ncbi:hypothetical protein LRH25_24615 [Ideonella azotifigens]|uniref:hypothetical protein n=1 Tax=Ideonella azotifigens TaxID=513160 RepID=UPI0031D81571|nr:hypothetical protein [Ideonella azotifigens]
MPSSPPTTMKMPGVLIFERAIQLSAVLFENLWDELLGTGSLGMWLAEQPKP